MNKKIFLTSVLLFINLCFCCLANQLNLFFMKEFKITEEQLQSLKFRIEKAYEFLTITDAFKSMTLHEANCLLSTLSSAYDILIEIDLPF